jgi:hypothetical protein
MCPIARRAMSPLTSCGWNAPLIAPTSSTTAKQAIPSARPTRTAAAAFAVISLARSGTCSNDAVIVECRNSDVTSSAPITRATKEPRLIASSTASVAPMVPIDGAPWPALSRGCSASSKVVTTAIAAKIIGHRVLRSFSSSVRVRTSMSVS